MKKNKDKSIYDQDETILDLQEKLSMVYKVMSLRPILVKHDDENETVMIAAQLTQPTLTYANVEEYMIQMLVGKDSIQHQLYASIIGYKDGILAAFHSQILQYLQENSVYYRNEKNGDKDASSSLLPKVGDFCVFKEVGQKIHFGIRIAGKCRETQNDQKG